MKHIRQIMAGVFAVSIVLFPTVASATELKAAQEYTLQKDAITQGDLYIAAQTNVIAGEVAGDLAIVGANVLITGTVEQDLFAAGGTVNVLGDIGDDIRAAGGTVTIGKNVGGDVVVAGGVIHVISGAIIEGDVLVVAGQLIIDGAVAGTVQVSGGEVTINGSVGKSVVVRSNERLSVGKSAIIGGDLAYRSVDAALIAEGATITGETKFEKIDRPMRSDKRARVAMAGLIGAMTLLKMAAMLLMALLGVALFRKTLQSLVKTATGNFGMELVRGFVILIVFPFAILFALLSIVGMGLGIMGLFAYVLLVMLANVLAGILLGAVIVKMVKKTKECEVTWQNATIGVVILQIVSIVPIFGWVFAFLLFLASLGSIALMLYQKAWLKRG